MIVSRFTPCNLFKIKNPKWSTREVLLARYRVGTHNEVIFTEAASMPGSYYLSGETIRACPVTTNGKLDCYAVPLDKLEPLERSA